MYTKYYLFTVIFLKQIEPKDFTDKYFLTAKRLILVKDTIADSIDY